mmetsp:Transcript_8676/g.9952  ORF Transcript_8676/g.9952 Transcript_8676/m.9952 type:complete len:96 (+) Transcript_8676:617-904(+)
MRPPTWVLTPISYPRLQEFRAAHKANITVDFVILMDESLLKFPWCSPSWLLYVWSVFVIVGGATGTRYNVLDMYFQLQKFGAEQSQKEKEIESEN